MKNTFKVLGIIALFAVIGFSMAACGDDSGGEWDGQDITNWPVYKETRMYFRVTNDKQIMAIDPYANTDDEGNYVPAIYRLLPDGKGNFPVGKWHTDDVWRESDKDVEFTITRFTKYFDGKPYSYNYTISGSYFILTPLF
jgi:hypothetical protein